MSDFETHSTRTESPTAPPSLMRGSGSPQGAFTGSPARIVSQSPPVARQEQRAAAVLGLLFRLSPEERLMGDFSCSFHDSAPVHGRIFVAESALCFYAATGEGEGVRKVLPFRVIETVRKRTVGLFFAALEVLVRVDEVERKYTFSSFFHAMRDRCYELCERQHRIHRPDLYARKLLEHGSEESLAVQSDVGDVSETIEAVVERGASGGEMDDTIEAVTSALRAVSSGRSFGEERLSMDAAAAASNNGGPPTTLSPVPELRRRRARTEGTKIDGEVTERLRKEEEEEEEVESSAPAVADPTDLQALRDAPISDRSLDDMALVLDTELECSTLAFYYIFLGDDAPKSLKVFHKNEDVSEMDAETWKYSDGSEGPFQPFRGELCRTMRYRMHGLPTSVPLMPESTRVEKITRLRFWKGPRIVVETSAKSFDVPMGDYFTTEDRWIIEPAPGPNRCRVQVGVRCAFSRFTMLKSPIISNTVSGSRDFHTRWSSFANSYLESPAGKAFANTFPIPKSKPLPPPPPTIQAERTPPQLVSMDSDSLAQDPSPLPTLEEAATLDFQDLLRAYARALIWLARGPPSNQRPDLHQTNSKPSPLPWWLPDAVEPLLPPPSLPAPRSFTLLLLQAIMILTLVTVVLTFSIIIH